MTALSQEEQDRLWAQAEEVKAAPKDVKRNLVGGPMNGKQTIIPENVQTNDVGWWTMHYVLQPAGFMLWSRKESVFQGPA